MKVAIMEIRFGGIKCKIGQILLGNQFRLIDLKIQGWLNILLGHFYFKRNMFWWWNLLEHVGNKVEYKVALHKIEHWLTVLDIFRFSKPSTEVYKQ